MGALEMVGQWQAAMRQLLPGVHGHQVKDLALFSFAMAQAHHCQSGPIASAVPSASLLSSRLRRWERLVSNPRLKVPQVCRELARELLPNLGNDLLLLLDETSSCGGRVRCMRLSVAYRKRAIPLAWVCYRPDAPPGGMPQLLWKLLSRLAKSIPPGVQVTLLADRGLCWPVVLDCCRHLHWHYTLRLQSQTRVQLANGKTRAVRDLARYRGSYWTGSVKIFKKSGWREANVVATWQAGCQERWLLVTDRPGSFRRCLSYGKRTWCEEMHRDEKSSGFRWDQSKLHDPARAQRLLLVMALAMLLCVSLGTYAIKHGRRHYLEPATRRLLSIFQLGLRWMRDALVQGYPLPCRVYLYPS
jgi:hypothetical protein